MAVRPIDANVAMKKIREYMEGFPNANTRLATCRVILSMLGDENQIPTLTQPNEPLTLDELREMDGEPVWWDNGDWGCWGIVTVDTDGFWAGIPLLRGRRNRINFEYNIKLNRMKIYRRPPEGEEET